MPWLVRGQPFNGFGLSFCGILLPLFVCLRTAAPLWGGVLFCALCLGVVDWHNLGMVLGALESGLGIGLDKYLHSVTFYVGMGPL